MSREKPNLEWVKNPCFNQKKYEWGDDGDVFLIAVRVNNTKTNKSYWQIDKVRLSCDEDCFALYHAGTEDCYTDWEWHDVEYYIKLEE